MYFDTKTISVIIVMTAFWLGIVMFVDWARNPVNKHSAMWAAGNGTLALGWLLLLLRGVIPDFLSIVIANTLIALCFAFLLFGTQWFLNMRADFIFGTGIVVAVFGGQTYWLAISAPVEVRLVYVPSLLAVLCTYCAWILVTRNDGRTIYPQVAAAAVFGAVGVASVVAAVTFAGAPKSISALFEPSVAVTALFLTFLMGVIGWSVGFLTMVGQRRHEDLRIQSEILTNMVEGVSMIRTSDTTIAYVNPKFEAMFGYGPGELNGKHISVLNVGNEMAVKELVENTTRYLEQNKRLSCAVHNKRKDGTEFWSQTNISIFNHAQFGEVWVSVHEDITERKHMEDELEHLATHDPLTGLYNRNTLEQILNDEMHRATRYNHAISVFMLDIDRFKPINDTYGHRTGDTVLRDFSRILESSIRKTDYTARYGGEEFVVILPETPFPKAEELAERLRSRVAGHPFPIEENKDLNLTASIGIATFPEHAQSWQDLLEIADSAMYVAKKAGRNQVKTP